jgi:5'(3')-deoxyribonucleotidase
LSDFTGYCVSLINELFGTQHRPEDVTTWDFKNLGLTEAQQAMLRMCLRGTDPYMLAPLPGAHDLVQRLSALGELWIVTSPMPDNVAWCGYRLEWLRDRFGIDRHRVVFAADKSAVDGVVLIDDYAKNLHQWEDGASPGGPGRRGILWEQPYSRDGYPWTGWSVRGVEAAVQATAMALVDAGGLLVDR